MSDVKVQDIRNIAFCGHGNAGKTTLVDKILNLTGAVKRPASVDDGTSICDFDDEEKHHKHSIESSLVHFSHGGKQFNLLDTPGYPDFIGQSLGSLAAVETAAILINAHDGMGVNTRRMFIEAGKLGLGRLVIVTKMESENVDFAALVETIREVLGHACIPLNVPIGQSHDFRGVVSTLKPGAKADGAVVNPADIHGTIVESIIEVDDAVTERYFEGTLPTDEELSRLIVEAVAVGSVVPIVCVSARSGVGVPELLDALALCSLPPDRIARHARNEAGQEVTLKADPASPLVAQIFKTRIDPFVHKLSFLRIFSGTLKKDDNVHVSGARKLVKLHQLLAVQGGETTAIDSASAGQIVAVAKVEELHTGLSLGDLTLPTFKLPTPMVGMAWSPKSRGDEAKLSGALHKIAEEDGTIRLHRDSQTKELVIEGMSELHLQFIRERLRRRDKVEIDAREPKIPYRETVQASAEGSYRHKKQTGGRGQFGEVHIRLFPMPTGVKPEQFATKQRFPQMREFHYDAAANFLWVDSIVGASIPNNFLPAVEKGFRERLERGVIAGCRIQDVCAEVFFGKHHPVDSSEAAFKTAGSMAFRDVFLHAKPGLLEPIVTLHVTVPGTKLGDINSDLSGRRGRVLGMDSAGGDMQTVTAEVPLSEVTSYARALSSLTGGQGSFTMEFARYDLVPPNVQKEVVEKNQHKEEEDE
jgi:elongation factor G